MAFMRIYKNESSTAVAYLRLSREDGDKVESDSIGNQRDLITDFVKRNPDIVLQNEYIDDGYSGTNFDRPSFQQMMEDIKKKKIDCIIVKDLSRFGRNYIETGRYIERIFPYMGIRFISVTDQYDSANSNNDSDQIIIPFKNLLNDAYCRDISVKIRSQLEVKRKNGKFTGSFASYGYIKDPEDNNHLVIDEQAAEVVRMIFNLKLEGVSCYNIAARLNEMGILTPAEYKRNCGLNFRSGFQTSKDPKWSAVAIYRVLKNEIYTGMMIQGKIRKINYKVKKSKLVNESEWVKVEGTHEPIIDKEMFINIRELLGMDTRTSPFEETVYLLSGFLKCGDCGQNLVKRTAYKKGKAYHYYHCTTYKNRLGCTSHLISEAKMIKIILNAINNQVKLVVKAERILSQLGGIPMGKYGINTLNKRLVAIEVDIEKFTSLKARLYQDKVEGLVSTEEYIEINERFTQKLNATLKVKDEIETKRLRLLTDDHIERPWIEEFKQYKNIETLERKVLASLIEKIVVYDKNKVEVCFKHSDEMMEIIQCIDTFMLDINEEDDKSRRVKNAVHKLYKNNNMQDKLELHNG